jgi:RHS repeat-associated protein
MLTSTDALNRVTTNVWDNTPLNLGNLLTTTNGASDQTTWTYDALGRRATEKDALHPPTVFAYDNNDSLLTRTDALGHVTLFAYDASGNRTLVVDANLATTLSTFDEKGRLVRVRDGLGNLTSHGYDALDRRTQTTDPRNAVTTFEYDAVGNLLRQVDPTLRATRHTYDANGNRLTTVDPRNKTTEFSYDAMNRLLTTRSAVGSVASSAYDLLGRVTSTTNARNKVTQYRYDALGRLTKVIAPTAAELAYVHDKVGNRISMTNAKNHTTTYAYDGANRLTKVRDPLGNERTFVYDHAGNRTSRTDGLVRLTTYAYDNANRLTLTSYDNATSVVRTLDANGNLTALTDRWGSESFAYDSLSRVVSHTDHFGRTLAYGYDATSNILTLTYPGNKVVSYGYDPAGRLAGTTDWTNRTVSYGYDAAGNDTSAVYPNGVTTSQAYDDAGRLIDIIHRSPDRDTLVSFAYTLDANGNRTRIVRVDRRAEPTRRGGADGFATSAALSAWAFPAGADSAVLVSGEDWAEAAGAAGLARRRNAPLLVLPSANLWASTAAQGELARLKAARPGVGGIIMGDIEGLSDAVEGQVGGLGIGTRRLVGADRYEAAAMAAAPAPKAVLLGGGDATRLGAAATLAARHGWPLLLCEADSVPAATRQALGTIGAGQVVLVGDATTIGTGAIAWLSGNGHAVERRFAESNAPELSAAMADYEESLGASPGSVALVRGDLYQDAFSAAASVDPNASAALFVDDDSLFASPEVIRWLGRHRGRLAGVSILSGTAGINASLADELRQTLRTTVTEYEYSDLDELTLERVPGVDTTLYAYDAMGNRTSETRRGVAKAYTYDGADRLSAAGGVTYGYDGNGNRASRTAASRSTTYAFDHEDRLVGVTAPVGTSQYDYDGLGRRIRSQEGGLTRRYVVDVTAKPYRTLADEAGDGTLERRYVYGAGLLADVTPTDTPRYFVYDGLGSTAAVTDLAGADVAHLGYHAFGDTAIALGTADTRMGYVGRFGVEAAAEGLTFMRDRFYDSETGMFLSEDPEEGGEREYLRAALYSYASGNPVLLIDPDGRFPRARIRKVIDAIRRGLPTAGKSVSRAAREMLGATRAVPSAAREMGDAVGAIGSAAHQMGGAMIRGAEALPTAEARMWSSLNPESYSFRALVSATKSYSWVPSDLSGVRDLRIGGMKALSAGLPTVGRFVMPLAAAGSALDVIDRISATIHGRPFTPSTLDLLTQ